MYEQRTLEQQMLEQQTEKIDSSNDQLLDTNKTNENSLLEIQKQNQETDELNKCVNEEDDEDEDDEGENDEDDEGENDEDDEDQDDEDQDDEDEEDETSVETEEEMTNSKEEIQQLIKSFYYKKTNSELKELLKIYNKPTKGNKINLVDRVLEIEGVQ